MAHRRGTRRTQQPAGAPGRMAGVPHETTRYRNRASNPSPPRPRTASMFNPKKFGPSAQNDMRRTVSSRDEARSSPMQLSVLPRRPLKSRTASIRTAPNMNGFHNRSFSTPSGPQGHLRSRSSPYIGPIHPSLTTHKPREGEGSPPARLESRRRAALAVMRSITNGVKRSHNSQDLKDIAKSGSPLQKCSVGVDGHCWRVGDLMHVFSSTADAWHTGTIHKICNDIATVHIASGLARTIDLKDRLLSGYCRPVRPPKRERIPFLDDPDLSGQFEITLEDLDELFGRTSNSENTNDPNAIRRTV